MARKPTTRSKGIRNNEPLAEAGFDVEPTDNLDREDGLSLLSSVAGYRSRPAGHGPDFEQYGYDD